MAVGDPDEHRFVALYGRRGRLWGVLGVNCPRLVMPYRNLLDSAASWDDALAFCHNPTKLSAPYQALGCDR